MATSSQSSFTTNSRLMTVDRPSDWFGGGVETVHGKKRRIWKKQEDESTTVTVSYGLDIGNIEIMALETRSNAPDLPIDVVLVETHSKTDEILAEKAVEIMRAVEIHEISKEIKPFTPL